MALTLNGNFQETPFSDVIAILRLQKATGTLTCTAKDVEKKIYVQGGQIIFATSQDEQDRLGEVMVRTGKLTRTQLNKSLELHKRGIGIKKIGAIFVEQGYVAPKELFNGLKQQVYGIIQSLFHIPVGAYHFTETMPSDVIPLQINMEELLREVIQQMKQGN